ncbi:putative gEgh 16 [Mycena kentingensis (nom. inval.)]|nr:putative gEgh 16 [Mycena kentingensis (nom. inval.)]
MLFQQIAFLAIALCSTVHAHGTITAVQGANGVQAAGFGVLADTPRDGTRRRPFQQDTSIIRDREIERGDAGACGRTLAGGNNDVATQLAAASQAGLPTTDENGALTMTLHQINGDGAGPYTCEVSTDGGNTFTAATVTTQVPGDNGRSRARAEDFPLVATVPAGTACAAGPNGDACIMRCRNPARAGPFGSCVAFSTGDTADATATNVGDGNATSTVSATAVTPVFSDAANEDDAATEAEAVEAAEDEEEESEDEAPESTTTAGSGDSANAGGLGGILSGAGGAGGILGNLGGAGGVAGKGGLGDLLSGILGNRSTQKKRYINSRIAGKNSGYWI